MDPYCGIVQAARGGLRLLRTRFAGPGCHGGGTGRRGPWRPAAVRGRGRRCPRRPSRWSSARAGTPGSFSFPSSARLPEIPGRLRRPLPSAAPSRSLRAARPRTLSGAGLSVRRFPGSDPCVRHRSLLRPTAGLTPDRAPGASSVVVRRTSGAIPGTSGAHARTSWGSGRRAWWRRSVSLS